MKTKLKLFPTFLFVFQLAFAQNKTPLEYVDSLVQSQDFIYVEDIRLNDFYIAPEKKINITDECLIKYFGKFDKKEYTANIIDDYNTIDYTFKRSVITLFRSDDNYFDKFDLRDSTIKVNPWGLAVGQEFERYKIQFPKTYNLIVKGTSPRSYYLISVKSKRDRDWRSRDMVIYINENKISRISYYYGE